MKPVSSAFVSVILATGFFSSVALAQNPKATAVAVANPAVANRSATNSAVAPVVVDPGAGKFASDLEKNSYAMGVLLAGDLKRQLARGQYENDTEVVIRAFSEALRGKTTVITDGEANVILRNYSGEIRKKMEEKRKVDGEKAKTAGEAYLAKNKKKEGVKVTASGLQYQVMKEGTGAKPTTNDTVQVHYRGTLIDGTEFDSSYSRGEPASFGVTRVIRGWTEALQLMPVGSKYKLAIPSELAYGMNGSPPKIAPSSALVFEVELVGIRPPPPAAPSPVVTSDIIRVPSAEDLKKGAKIEVIKASDAERLQQEAQAPKKSPAAPK